MIGWNFPLNNDGPEVGLNDAGIETFKGKRLDALAREINQNSNDAKVDYVDEPVEVHFELHSLPIFEFPNLTEYKKILENCLDYWKEIEKTKHFFENALKTFDSPTIPVLKISDYNTSGLTGSNEERRSNWHSLIKAIGVSNKSSNAGGSFGIGKHAPFACSSLRTVFYGTLDIQGVYAFQGVAKLATHLKDGEPTQGTGYFGITERNKPLIDNQSKLPEIFHRHNTGTDIYVMGFNGGGNWEEEIIKSILENFFYAVFQNKLVVKVGDTLVNKESLPILLEKYTKESNDCLSFQYYHALIEGQALEGTIKGYDNVKLYLLPGSNFPKKVAMVRGTGMKIYDKGHFRGLTKFIGVLVAEGPEINKFLRLTEPPSHDKWEYERYEDNVSHAKKVLASLNNWINEQVRSLNDVLGEIEELDIEGVSQYLPDDDDNVSLDNEPEQLDETSSVPVKVEVESVPSSKNSGVNSSAPLGEVAVSGEGESIGPGGDGKPNDADGGNPPNNGTGTPDDNGDAGLGPNNEGSQKEPVDEPAKPKLILKNFRTFCKDPAEGKYMISFTPSRNGTVHLKVKIVGDQGDEDAYLKSAINKNSNQSITVNKNSHLGPVSFTGGTRENIEVILQEPLRCALGVTMYEG